jgi:hypothetical protein
MQVTSYPEKSVRFIPLPPWLSIIVIWEIIFLADYLIVGSATGGGSSLWLFGSLIVFFISVCINAILCSQELLKLFPHLHTFVDLPSEDLERWYSRQLKECYEGWKPLLCGVAIGAAAGWTLDPLMRELTQGSDTLYYFRHAYHFIGYFFLGMALWALIRAATIPLNMAKFKIKVSSYQVRGTGLQALGRAYFRMAIFLSTSFFIMVAIVAFSPFATSAIVMAWLAIGAVSIFLFFVVPQMGIHRIMAEVKYKKLDAFSIHLDAALEQSINQPTPENMQRLKELFELQQHLKNMNEWPFELSMIWQLVTALIIPLAMAAVEIFFKK